MISSALYPLMRSAPGSRSRCGPGIEDEDRVVLDAFDEKPERLLTTTDGLDRLAAASDLASPWRSRLDRPRHCNAVIETLAQNRAILADAPALVLNVPQRRGEL